MVRKVKRLTRSDDRILGGVLAGFAEYFEIDPTLVRLLFVLVALLTAVFPLVIFYIIAWIVMPERSGSRIIDAEAKNTKRRR